MKSWFVIGLAASLLYGVSALFFKLLTSERYLGGHPAWVLTAIGSGIALCGALGVIFGPMVARTGGNTLTACALGVPAGLLNGLATLLVLWALRSPATNLSQLVPIYNTNTLVAFALAVVLLKELPHGSDLLRNLAGALLIVIGSWLIGVK